MHLTNFLLKKKIHSFNANNFLLDVLNEQRGTVSALMKCQASALGLTDCTRGITIRAISFAGQLTDVNQSPLSANKTRKGKIEESFTSMLLYEFKSDNG